MRSNHRLLALTALVLMAVMLCTSLAVPMALAEDADVGDTLEEDSIEGIEFVENPTEELEFIDSLIDEIGLPEDALEAVNGMTNILLIGIDARPNERTGRSDTMIILTIDAEHGSLKLTSFMRDLYVEIPGRSSNRLNAAYVFGGADLLKQTIKHNFGIDVDYHVTVTFTKLADVIDQLGGLELTIEPRYVSRANRYIANAADQFKTSGTYVFTGVQVQAYVRYRYGDPEGDASRTRRQREVILKTLDKIKGMSLASLAKLIVDNLDQIETNIPMTEMLRLAPALFELYDAEVKELKIPISGAYRSAMIHGMAVYVPDRTKNQKAVLDFILETDSEP